MLRARHQGYTIGVVLMVLSVVVVIAFGLSTVGLHSLSLAQADRNSQTALYAAEAGVAAACATLKYNPNWGGPLPLQSMSSAGGSLGSAWFSVELTNNYSGPVNAIAVDGTQVPPGCVYLRSTGSAGDAPARLTASRTIRALYRLTAAGPMIFKYAAFGNAQLTFSGGSQTDSWNSSNGAYGASNSFLTGGDIATNDTVHDSVDLSGGTTYIHGDVAVGPGGNVSTAIVNNAQPRSASYNSSSVMTDSVALPGVNLPTAPGTTALKITSSTTLPPGAYGDVSVSGGATLTLAPGYYVFNSLSMSGSSVLSAPTSGNVTIYIASADNQTTGLNLTGGTVVNPQGYPPSLTFYCSSACTTVDASGGMSAYYAVYAPQADITVSGGSNLYGSLVGSTVKDTGGTFIHYDQALKARNSSLQVSFSQIFKHLQ